MTSPVGFTLLQLRYFLVAAERGSMTEASGELHIAQSAVSAAIHNLERDLGAQLFIRRRGRGLTLTPAGRGFSSTPGSCWPAPVRSSGRPGETVRPSPGRWPSAAS